MLKVWDAEDVVSDHSHRVRRVDEEAMLTKDHVTVLEGRQTDRGQKARPLFLNLRILSDMTVKYVCV